jgi:hypothetical protein
VPSSLEVPITLPISSIVCRGGRGYATFSYAPLSIETTFSTPETFEASSATDFMLGPATNAVTDPPSFCAAVTAPREACTSLPSFCSRIASDDRRRASAESDATGVTVLCCVRTWRRAVCPILEIIVGVCNCEGEKESRERVNDLDIEI